MLYLGKENYKSIGVANTATPNFLLLQPAPFDKRESFAVDMVQYFWLRLDGRHRGKRRPIEKHATSEKPFRCMPLLYHGKILGICPLNLLIRCLDPCKEVFGIGRIVVGAKQDEHDWPVDDRACCHSTRRRGIVAARCGRSCARRARRVCRERLVEHG